MSSAELAIVAAAAFVVCALCCPIAMRVATRAGVVDRPGPLKPQALPVPYLGGVAIFAGTVVGAAVGHALVLVPLGLALAIGVLDDRAGLSPRIRLVGEVAVGGAVAGVLPTRLPVVVGPLCVVAVTVLLVNGVNLIDGLDALAAGVVAAAAAAFAALVGGDPRALAVALLGASVGFLLYNRPPARLYLGDGGAYLLGAALAVLVVWAWAPGVRAPVGIAALVVVAVPAAEILFSVVRRLRGRRPLLAGDRGHPYDRLVQRGWPRPAASLAYIATEALLGAVAVAVSRRSGTAGAVALAVATGVVLTVAAAVGGALAPDREPSA